MVEPTVDLEQVREAFRLGWVVSELRGRCRSDRFEHPLPREIGEQIPPRLPNALPLATERKPGEVRIELAEGARQLSKALGLDETRLEAAAQTERPMTKNQAEAFYRWDACIQDTLLLQATQAAAYQLGRGLADTYWAYDPADAEDGMTSGQFLLGEERYETLQRLTMRLSPYLGPLTVAAVTGSLARWHEYAMKMPTGEPFSPGATLALYRQGLLWRDLIRGERLPQDLVNDPLTPQPNARDAWEDAKPYWAAFTALRLPLLFGGLGAAGFILGAALLAGGTSHPGWSTALSIAGGLGLTSATLYARAKAQIVSLFDTFSALVAARKVARAADLTPPGVPSIAASERRAVPSAEPAPLPNPKPKPKRARKPKSAPPGGRAKE